MTKKSRGFLIHLRGVRCFSFEKTQDILPFEKTQDILPFEKTQDILPFDKLRIHSAISQVLRSKTGINSGFFPHISRKKTAKIFKNWRKILFLYLNRGLKLTFLFFVFCFLFLNLHSSLFPKNEKLSQAKKQVLVSPFNAETHISLARVYLEMGDFESAEKELSLAQNLTYDDFSDLKKAEKALEKEKGEPEKIREEISFWKNIVKEKPDYRDAYFQLAILNYQVSQNKEAKKYLQKVFNLDPNFQPAKKLEKLL